MSTTEKFAATLINQIQNGASIADVVKTLSDNESQWQKRSEYIIEAFKYDQNDFVVTIPDPEPSVWGEWKERAFEIIDEQIIVRAKESIRKYADMLDFYYGLQVPHNIIEALIAMYPQYKIEHPYDTVIREMFCGDLMKYIGMGAWPCYGDSVEYKTNFFKILDIQCAKFGIINS